jgi:hypothetical protein
VVASFWAHMDGIIWAQMGFIIIIMGQTIIKYIHAIQLATVGINTMVIHCITRVLILYRLLKVIQQTL